MVDKNSKFLKFISFLIYFFSAFLGWLLIAVFGQASVFILPIIGVLTVTFLSLLLAERILRKSKLKKLQKGRRLKSFLSFLLIVPMVFYISIYIL